MTTVEVLLSTYDGSRWLTEQLDSLLAQRDVAVRISARDDGSTDATPHLLRQYASRHPNVRWRAGPNVGPAASFLELLQDCSPDVDLVAFSDQDDVWEPDHLARAAASLRGGEGEPRMWCSDVLVCDGDLNPVRRHAAVRRGCSWANALVENVATGSTIVLDRAAVRRLTASIPSSPVMHDAWCYLVVAATGTVLYDPTPSVRYRQHGANALGLADGRVGTVLARLRRARSGPHVGAWTRQARDLERGYADVLPADVLREVRRFTATAPRARLTYALTGRAHRQRRVESLAARGLHVLGRL